MCVVLSPLWRAEAQGVRGSYRHAGHDCCPNSLWRERAAGGRPARVRHHAVLNRSAAKEFDFLDEARRAVADVIRCERQWLTS
jgi:hypothetical protein